MPCPTPDLLAAYADRALPAEAASGLEAHAAACPVCLDALRLLTDPRGRTVGLPRSHRPLLLRAAAVLLAVSLSALAWRGLRYETPRPGPTFPASSSFPAWPQAPQALAPAGWTAAGIDIVPQPGARLSLAQDGQGHPLVRLQAGAAWIRGSEALRLQTPAGSLPLSGAEVWVEAPSSPVLSWLFLGEARAADAPELMIVPLEGRVGQAGPGQALAFSAGNVSITPIPMERLAALRRARLQRLKALGAWRDLLPAGSVLDAGTPAEAFSGAFPVRWRLLLRLEGRNPATEVAVLLPTPGGTRQWAVRLPSRSRAADADLEILSDGTRFLARLDGRTLMDLPAGMMAGSLEPAGENASPGLRSWGGAVTVASARLQELP